MKQNEKNLVGISKCLATAEEQLHYLRCPLVTLKNKKGAGLYTK